MPAYYYSSTAGAYTLTGAINSSTTSVGLSSVSGLPTSTPFKVVLDPGQPTEEIVKVTNVAGTTLTVVRGWDGSSAVSHSAGATVRHMLTAEDIALSRTHEDATAAHGATGAVVGTTNSQALTNKDLSSATNAFPTSLATDVEVANAVGTHAALSAGVHGAAGSVVGTTDPQTLTNKTINGANNSLSNIPQSAITSLTTDLAALDTRLDTLEVGSGAVSSGIITASSGWSITQQKFHKVGPVCHLYALVSRSGGTIAAASDGNITDSQIAQISSSANYPSVPVSGRTVSTGFDIGVYATEAGVISVGNVVPGQAINTGNTLSFSLVWVATS